MIALEKFATSFLDCSLLLIREHSHRTKSREQCLHLHRLQMVCEVGPPQWLQPLLVLRVPTKFTPLLRSSENAFSTVRETPDKCGHLFAFSIAFFTIHFATQLRPASGTSRKAGIRCSDWSTMYCAMWIAFCSHHSTPYRSSFCTAFSHPHDLRSLTIQLGKSFLSSVPTPLDVIAVPAACNREREYVSTVSNVGPR